MRQALSFQLAPGLRATAPAEARGVARDQARMLVAYRGDGRLLHCVFSAIVDLLGPDDLVVINTSATLPAAVVATDVGTGAKLVVHFSNRLSGWPEALAGRGREGEELWVVEPRRPAGATTKPWAAPKFGPGDTDGADEARRAGAAGRAGCPRLVPPHVPRELRLGAENDGQLSLLAPYRGSSRLWTASLKVPGPALAWLGDNGQPIRYGYAQRSWPISAYQNVYATEPGSAEMPSAGRPFTAEVLTRLVAKGVGVAPIVLHTGVASLELDEAPYPEPARVPPATARRVNATRQAGGRVIAVGTTVVRALESAFNPERGEVEAFADWTDLVISRDRGVEAVDGLLTGWHEPEASHLAIVEAIAGPDLLAASYDAALSGGYLWHEFGDVALYLPH